MVDRTSGDIELIPPSVGDRGGVVGSPTIKDASPPDHHPPNLAHHFDSYGQQQSAASLGVWVFLVTEIMFFGGLFTAYVLYRSKYPEAFIAGSHQLDVTLGTINTAVLICSSLTMAMAVRSAQLGRAKAIVGFLVATIVLGSAFLGVKPDLK